MNEDEWLTGTDFTAHARYAAEHLSPRRQRLLAVAFCRAAGALLDHPDLTDALDVIDQYADELAPPAAVARARQECRAVASEVYNAYSAAVDAAAQHLVMRAVVWEVAGNPFREPHFSEELRTDTAMSLACQMYDNREFSAMPILADAIQDAGCDDEVLLAHCRNPGEHVRGCWVLDLVLGK